MLLSQIQQRLKQPKNRQAIERGIYHGAWLKFHNETILRKNELGVKYRELCAFIDEILPEGKAARWKQLFPTPAPTLELTESIFTQLSKVFTAEDRYFSVEDQEFFESLQPYRKYFRNQVWLAVQHDIDSVLVVDFPRQQSGVNPEPYLYLVSPSQIVDIENDDENVCEYLIYKSGKEYVALCDEFYRIFDENKNLAEEIPHELGVTPARSIWTDNLMNNYVNKLSPITKSLSELDWLVIHKVNKRYLDLGNSFPIMAAYRRDEQFDDKEGDEKTDLNKGSDLLGPGSLMEFDPPLGVNDVDLLKNPLQIIAPDITSLDYNVREEIRKTDIIFYSTVGFDGEPENDQAKNEKQIASGFESRKSILQKIARNMEQLECWCYTIIGKSKFGKDFDGVNLSYGELFFQPTTGELYEKLQLSKKTGNYALIESYQSQINTVRFQGKELTRQKVIAALDQYPTSSIEELKELAKDKFVTLEEIRYKMQLLALIKRFERENTNIVDFGAEIDFSTKVDRIKQQLLIYLRENESKQESEI